jgi:hypothetical protein
VGDQTFARFCAVYPWRSRQVKTIDNAKHRVSSERTRKRCSACKKFARLLPGDTECATCSDHLDLPITTIRTGAVRALGGHPVGLGA